MFTEILKIVPRIDKAALAIMQSQLTKRFLQVAGRFGKGLEKVMKGNLLFMSIGFVTQLLNPLEKVHDKIKELLGEGFDIDELAGRFNTAPGTVKRLQALGQSLGLEPGRLNDLMTKFADAIEKAREEIANPTVEPSKATRALTEFVDEKDLAKGFFQFIRSLQSQGKNEGTIEVDRRTGEAVQPDQRDRLRAQGLTEKISGQDLREQLEKEIFGEVQHGAAKRLIDSDFIRAFEQIGLRAGDIEKPGSPEWLDNGPVSVGFPNRLDKAIENLIQRANQQRIGDTKNQVNDFILSSNMVTEQAVTGMNAADERERKADRRDLSQAELLQRSSKNIDELLKVLVELRDKVLEFVGFISGFIPQLMTALNGMKESLLKMTDSRLLRGLFK